MLPDLPAEQFAAILDEIVLEVLVAAGIGEPPVDAFMIARSLGIVVAADVRQLGRARYVRLSSHAEDPDAGFDGPSSPLASILVRPEPRSERRHWAVAHELGEHLAPEIFERLGVDPCEAPEMRESVANALAGRLLLPTAWFYRAAVACHWNLLALKAAFTTASHELIARRMLDFEPAVIVTICDHAHVTFRRSNVLSQSPPLAPLEWQCWQEVHAHARPADRWCDAFCVDGWPIHEENWKREILRTSVNAE